MQKLILYSFVIFFYVNGYSQKNSIEVLGTLSDELGSVVNAHVVNITSKQGTFSSVKGGFTIKVKVNDVLEITSIQHRTERITIATITLKKKKLDLKLHLKEYVLEEVEIKKTDLSGVLMVDAKEIGKSEREEIMENLGFNPHFTKISKIDREIKEARGSGLIPLNLVINTLTGRLKFLKKKKKILENGEKLNNIESTHRNYIENSLNIDSLNVVRFIYFSHLDKKFKEVYKKGDLALIIFLKEQAVLFKNKQ